MTSKDFLAGDKVRRLQLQLKLDVDDIPSGPDGIAPRQDRPRPIAFGLAAALQRLLPGPAQAHELAELTAPERADLFRMAQVPALQRAELEDGVRRALRRRYRRAA